MESSSDEEEQLEYWDNWLCPMTDPLDEVGGKLGETVSETEVKVVDNLSTLSPDIPFEDCNKFGNWVPPKNFLNVGKNVRRQRHFQKEKECQVSKTVKKNGMQNRSCAQLNSDWGERRELHDVMKMKNGDLIWGIVQSGIFGNIKLWVNEYSNICCLASGKISKLGSSEMTFISITDTQILRKMLDISSSQWASLCETIKETTTALRFDAFEDCDLGRKTSLERLWYFICKRRHFLPRQCMLLKYSGAIKCMKEFSITPKLLVQDIRNLSGEPIL